MKRQAHNREMERAGPEFGLISVGAERDAHIF